MKIIAAPDSFKGSLTAIKASEAIEEGVRSVFKDAEVLKVPIADGGEGTVDAITAAVNGETIYKNVHGPMGSTVKAKMALIDNGNTAVIEMAEASGITLVPDGKKNPLKATTYGTGELIMEAINRGCSRIVIGIGGSATNDCGAGMAQALGYQILNVDGNETGFGGGELSKVESIIISPIKNKIDSLDIVVACDVNNPLCGETGASKIYGPQKGATPEMVETLDKNLMHFAGKLKNCLGRDVKDVPGAGAAGGLGAGLMAFLNARLVPGIELILKTVDFEGKVKDADLVITGEGRVDRQSAFGKVPMGIGRASKKYNVPVIAIGGSIGEGAEALYDVGVDAICSIVPRPMDLKHCMENSYTLLRDAVERAMRIYAINR